MAEYRLVVRLGAGLNGRVKAARDARIDAYIEEAEPFARPILTRLRKQVHAAVPGVTETIKWHMPFFEHGGSILCFMGAFKAHCGFGFWRGEMKKVLGPAGAKRGQAMGNFGRLTRVEDLPSKAAMQRFLKKAAKLNEAAGGSPTKRGSARVPR